VLIAIAWRPLIRPVGAGAIIVGDIYTSALWDRNVMAYVTPAPRIAETTETIHAGAMRVSWFVPGWGDRHAAVMLVNGATSLGNDDPETRRLAEALARGGYLVMLPEFPFIKGGVLEREASAYIADAFALMVARPDTHDRPHGAFGFSVGGGMLLAAASRPGAFADAAYVAALGAYFDLDTYLASVVTGAQDRSGALEAWDPDPEVRLRLPVAAAEALGNAGDRETVTAALRTAGGHLSGAPPASLTPEGAALWNALASTDYFGALDRLRALPPSLRDVFDRLSPRTSWQEIRAPVFWLHDVGDRFEPLAEAERAAATPHRASTRLQKTAVISHAAAVGQAARAKDLVFWAEELSGLLAFAAGVLETGG
jgi:dienelactone hydrolase